MTSNPAKLSDAPLFAGCPNDERELLQTMAVPMRIAAGNDVLGQGDFGKTIGVLIEGRASVWKDGMHLVDLQPGDVFGEMAILAPPSSHGHRTATIRADSEVRVDTVSERDLNAELGALPNVADALRRLGATREA